jgi:hypothetical protein
MFHSPYIPGEGKVDLQGTILASFRSKGICGPARDRDGGMPKPDSDYHQRLPVEANPARGPWRPSHVPHGRTRAGCSDRVRHRPTSDSCPRFSRTSRHRSSLPAALPSKKSKGWFPFSAVSSPCVPTGSLFPSFAQGISRRLLSLGV